MPDPSPDGNYSVNTETGEWLPIEPATVGSISRRGRARNEDGTYRADDPTTPDVDEAWVETSQ